MNYWILVIFWPTLICFEVFYKNSIDLFKTKVRKSFFKKLFINKISMTILILFLVATALFSHFYSFSQLKKWVIKDSFDHDTIYSPIVQAIKFFNTISDYIQTS